MEENTKNDTIKNGVHTVQQSEFVQDSTENNDNKKDLEINKIFLIIFAIFVLCLGKFVGNYFFKKISGVSAQEDALSLTIKDLKKQLPKKVDNYTTVFDVKLLKKGKTNIISYSATVSFRNKQNKSLINKDNKIKDSIIAESLCPGSEKLLKSNINAEYIYFANDGSEIMRFNIDKQLCRQYGFNY